MALIGCCAGMGEFQDVAEAVTALEAMRGVPDPVSVTVCIY